jgi:hypothetical protein
VSSLLLLIFSQRVYLDPIYAYVCLLFLYQYVIKKSDVYLLFSLLTVVDNGGGAYYETPGIIRYLIWSVAIYRLIDRKKFTVSSIILLLGWVLALTVLGVLNIEEFDLNTFKNNIFIIVCFFLISGRGGKLNINLNQVVTPILFLGFGELINLYFGVVKIEDYLNYNTSKYIIAIPALVMLVRKEYLKFFCIAPITFLILINYGSRMASLIFIVTIALEIFSVIKITPNSLFLLIILGFTFGIFQDSARDGGVENDMLDSYKFGRLIYNVMTENDPLELLDKIDPVRSQEHKLFFDRNWYEILFGGGLGRGIRDVKGYLSVVGYSNTAFSDEELESKTFHRFHDLWIDFSLRFGVIAFLVVLGKLLIGVYSHGSDNKLKSLLVLGFVFTAYYSYIGLLITTVIYCSQVEGCEKI